MKRIMTITINGIAAKRVVDLTLVGIDCMIRKFEHNNGLKFYNTRRSLEWHTKDKLITIEFKRG